MPGVGVPVSDSISHRHGHHMGGIAEMVVTAASAIVSNLVGMTGTELGLSVQIAPMKVQWCVSLINFLPRQAANLFRHRLLSVSIDQLDNADAPPIPGAYVSPWRAMLRFTLLRRRGIYLPSLQHPCGPKTSRGFNRAWACTGPPRLLRCPKQSQHGRVTTARAMLIAG